MKTSPDIALVLPIVYDLCGMLCTIIIFRDRRTAVNGKQKCQGLYPTGNIHLVQ